MASKQETLNRTLTPALLSQVNNFWFSHICTEDARILPGKEDQMRWFKKDEQFDAACVEQFKPALDTLLNTGATAPELLAAVDTSSCLNWVSLLLLLDQIPRNCYRGDAAKIVFSQFDPLAVGVALEAVERGIPMLDPDVRWRLAYRTWFFLPLMHSEDLGVHERAIRLHEETREDFEGFLKADAGSLEGREKACYDVLKGREEELRERLKALLDFEARHKAIVERFGKYPHRNQAMGRESTLEEAEYLENGGETFG
ncbi:hypothetical protein N7468_006629 [Penicillium chermesinum]|uniref:DUF924-domain-containing protein n=1 Tax=Penicillium chermesinum TaxID=63820 RepID=A0A9W9NSR5_9EURO|nr:uncharacterized protein N7468_006629 [Penicillium chermesinum]KAJ5225404.1 hypothetical protein N7468_006629 [Penicillium chermesinum]KAJ6161371.1 hypothetical protein N7470_004767 [Penicillium chermesinum]